MGYTKLRPEDQDVECFHDVFFKMRRALGTTAFGLNEIRMPPGFEGLEHDETETGHEEVYVALDGGGTCTIDGEQFPFVAGDYLRVDSSATRRIVAGDEGLRFLVVAGRPKPGYDGRAML